MLSFAFNILFKQYNLLRACVCGSSVSREMHDCHGMFFCIFLRAQDNTVSFEVTHHILSDAFIVVFVDIEVNEVKTLFLFQ